ncbi:immediate early response 3-interacting protein 1 [Piromyces finnis]|uniref:Immediate early response 3-interacting protein 1 n=1 Tax=Piromyces finnis TaxID=1754191 RepID=A0A1Y1V889_9FUNG|nr:immediate early response 3-interacting protein 1 [Piromyces finnis]|eukprot:ORX49678.1 immediate early response 3-interacting protein 1 [Piromyces finnis]
MASLVIQIIIITLLFINSVAILHEDRFLARIGWSKRNNNGYNTEPTIKSKIVDLISATRTLLRIPLIVINSIVILYLLILG